jgi:hypothetical protein
MKSNQLLKKLKFYTMSIGLRLKRGKNRDKKHIILEFEMF